MKPGRLNRGRDAHYGAPPAQIRASPIRALGSHLGCVTAKRAVRGPAPLTRLPGPEPGACGPDPRSPRPPPFAPPTPRTVARRCSPASPLLWRGLTSPVRASSATAPRLPDADQTARGPVVGREISRFPCQERGCMPGSLTRPDRPGARASALDRVAFRFGNSVGIRNYETFAAQWLACTVPCRRFAPDLAARHARLGADVDRYSFVVSDSHRLLLAGLPAHYQVPDGVTRWGFQREAGLIQGGERGRFAMPVPLRTDFDANALRAIARTTKDGLQARRPLALAAIYDGATRTAAARIGGVTVQIIRDWVVKFNAHWPEGLINRKPPGQPSKLADAHRAALQAIVEQGPIPAIHGVVRWRLVDLIAWVWEEFRLSISKQTLSRELRAMGYRKLSARPRHHAKNEAAVAAFKKTSRPV